MSIDERREILTYNRPAGPKSDLVGPVINKKTVKLKKPQFVKRDNYGFNREGCNLGQLNQCCLLWKYFYLVAIFFEYLLMGECK